MPEQPHSPDRSVFGKFAAPTRLGSEVKFHGMRLNPNFARNLPPGNVPGSANGDEDIGIGQRAVNVIHPQRHLAKPDHVRTRGGARNWQQWHLSSRRDVSSPLQYLSAPRTAHLQQLAVHMNHPTISRAFVRVINVLGNQHKSIAQRRFQPRQPVCRIRRYLRALRAAGDGRYKTPASAGSRAAKATPASPSSTRCSSTNHRPRETFLIPDSAEMPAPVNTTTTGLSVVSTAALSSLKSAGADVHASDVYCTTENSSIGVLRDSIAPTS